MISKKIFLGTIDNFVVNQKALSMYQMQEPFVYFNNYQCYNHKQVGYTITSTSNQLFEKDQQRMKRIKEDIQESDVCIIDITPIDSNKNLPLLVGETLIACIEQNKKIILIHNHEVKEDDLNLITSHIKKENLLGLFSHDGKQFPEHVMECLDNHYAKDSKYNRNSRVTIDDKYPIDIVGLLSKWVQEKELGGFCFYHIYINYDYVEIHYQGYNTPTLCALTIDGISKLGLRDRFTLKNQLREIAQGNPEHIFVHVSMNEARKHQRKI